jgi:hypothetical protein
LCLLEAQGDRFAQLSDKPTDVVPRSSVDKLFSGTKLKHTTTSFKAVWTPVTSGLETVWSPAMLYLAEEDSTSDLTTERTAGVAVASDGNVLSPHEKITSRLYSNFNPPLSSTGDDARKPKASDPAADLLKLAIPELMARAPLHKRAALDGARVSDDEAGQQGRGKEKARPGNQSLPSLAKAKMPLLQPAKEIPRDTVGAIGGSLFARKPEAGGGGIEGPSITRGLPPAVIKCNPARATVNINQHNNRDT